MKKILALVMAMTMAPQRRAPLRKIRQKTPRLQRMRRLLPREILIR